MAIPTFKYFAGVVRADLYRHRGATGLKGLVRTYWRTPGFRYVFWMRVAGFLHRNRPLIVLYTLSNWLHSRLTVKYGINIPHNTRVGPGLFIGHWGGIVVNEDASIGRNCNLSHGVTIGQKNRGKFKGCPRIGDSVYIGPGAAIIGSVSVGSNAAIGANTVVVADIPDNAVVVGNPGRVISSKGSDGYVNWTVEE